MRKNRSPARLRTVQCEVCTSPFQTRHSQGRYCSRTCSKEAQRASWRAYADRNRDTRRSYHRSLYDRNRDAIIARTRAYQQTKAGKAAASAAYADQLLKHPERIFARQVVTAALRAGYMTRQPCERCGAAKSQAHHLDYMDPFTVEWLCSKCHGKEHRKERNK